MTTLVTGAAGFIGFHVCQQLMDQGRSVVGFDNINDYYDISLKEARLRVLSNSEKGTFICHRQSLESLESLRQVFETHNITRIIHLAAQAGVRYSIEAPRKYIESNVIGFLNILDIAKQYEVQHLLYASSSSVYGDNSQIPFSVEAKVDRPVSIYAMTKIANELMAHVYHHQYGLNVTGLRFFTVYGPWGRPDMSPFIFLKALLTQQPIKLFNDGNHRRDFTYIDDIVAGVLKIHDGPITAPAYKLYNIGRGEPVGLLEYIKTLESIVGVEAQTELLPMQAGDVEETFADVSALERDYGYRPNTTLDAGLRKFVSWYRDYYKL